MLNISQILSPRLWSSFVDVKHLLATLSKSDLSVRMKALVDKQQCEEALTLFDKHQQLITDQSINQALKACSKQRDLHRGMIIHQQLSSKLTNNPFILSSLIHLYMQCGDTITAQRLFIDSKHKTSSMYATMLKGYVTNHMADKTIELFQKMLIEPTDIILIALFNACAQLGDSRALDIGKKALSQMNPKYKNHIFLLTSALDMFIKCDDVPSAEDIFVQIPMKTVIKYGAMMKGFNKNNEPMKTFSLFEQMKKESILPNEIIFILLIDACSQIGMISRCRTVVKQIPSSILILPKIQTGLIDIWGKSGHVTEAKRIFQTNAHPDIVTYTAMIHSYGLNGMGSDAVDLFRRIPNEIANELTYLVVLNACSHSGLLDVARSIFHSIPIKTDKICTAMVDGLSRMFLFDEAEKIVEEFEENHPPYMPMYMALLSGARNQGNSSLAQNVFKKIEKNFGDREDGFVTAASILLANTYSSAGEYEKSFNIKEKLHRSHMKKVVGVSWTEVNGELAQFRAHDKSHTRSSEIYEELNRLSAELIKHGHQFDASWITRPIGNDENVASVLCGHSEKLALAFNFIQKSIPSPIQITKNLRICGDCHRATKLIAQIRRTEIIIRDANRFHHFDSDGNCSCHDHF